MCNARPGTRCASSSKKSLNTAIAKADKTVEQAEKLADAVRISRKSDDIEFNAERYENVSKSIPALMEDINNKKIYLYAANTPSKEIMRENAEATKHFGPFEQQHLKDEDTLVRTSVFLRTFQEHADKRNKENSRKDSPVSQKDLARKINTKLYPEIHKKMIAQVNSNFEAKTAKASTAAERKQVKAERERMQSLVNDAYKMARDDAGKLYETKKQDTD